MQTLKRFAVLLSLILLLAACGNAQSNTKLIGELANEGEFQSSGSGPVSGNVWPDRQSQEDAQGAVTIKVIAQNLNNFDDTIDFNVALDTHSVDLSMDLATLSTLTTNNGMTVKAKLWNAPRGGHHVIGILSFPASVDSIPVMDGSTKITLTIRDVDAAERIYSWER